MRRLAAVLALAAVATTTTTHAAEWFPLSQVRITAGPMHAAQERNRQTLLALEPARLLAPFRREAGLPALAAPYGNWESSGLDGHIGGHYLSAMAMMVAATDDAELRRRLDAFVAALGECQQRHQGTMAGYLGGVPGSAALWEDVARGQLEHDSFSLNGRWVPWYNVHKTFAGLRDAHVHGGSAAALGMLVKLADWAERVTQGLTPAQMQGMLRAEHGGMVEVLVDVARLSGEARHLATARRFVDQGLLGPLQAGEDRLSGLHANTQIPKLIGAERLAQADSGAPSPAARYFWGTVQGRRSVAIGGNGVREHFHALQNFDSMLSDVQGPETCNTYNMLRLSGALFQAEPQSRYMDYAERALFNHILSSQHPGTGGFVYFTPMRPNHYRNYSRPGQAMWCCVGSGLESHAKYGELIYARDAAGLYVNLFVSSQLSWPERGLRITQETAFPDASNTTLVVHGQARMALRVRHPAWLAPGALRLRLNGRSIQGKALRDALRSAGWITLQRHWRDGDRLEIELPMHTWLEPLPGGAQHAAVLHGPIVLAARTAPLAGETLQFFADDSRMGHVAAGPTCEPGATYRIPDPERFLAGLRPVPGQPLVFRSADLWQGGGAAQLQLEPFFRLHESRYEIYWPLGTATPTDDAAADAELRALDALTLDRVVPGEQQQEVAHAFQAEGGETGVFMDRRWRHAKGWFAYELADPQRQGRALRLELSRADGGRLFDVEVNGRVLSTVRIDGDAAQAFYPLQIALPSDLVQAGTCRLRVRFVARDGSLAGGLYDLRLLRER